MAAKTATFVRKAPSSWTGDARLYRLSEPVQFNEGKNTTFYVVVSAANALFSGPETYIFPADKSGECLDWLELDGSFEGSFDHELALNRAGFTVIRRSDD